MRSLSNMIKAYSIRYDEELKKTIDAHLRIDKEIEQKKKVMIATGENTEEFSQGIQAVVLEQLPSQEELKEKSDKLIEDAKLEAKLILEKAKQEAEKMKNDAYSTGQHKGYEEGMQQSLRESQKLAADYEAKTKQLQKEYEAALTELEPKMVEIMISMIEKITGILVEGKEEVILYMVSKALKNMDKSKEFTIRVSNKDIDHVSNNKQLLLEAIGREVILNVTEDSKLKPNQCLIETELSIVDCSLDVQLHRLITDLKLLGNV